MVKLTSVSGLLKSCPCTF